MSLERLGAQHEMAVVDKYHAPIADYTMTARDYIVRPSADDDSGPITITLPPVSLAKGRFYSIFVRDADGTNTVTIDDNNDDSERWFLTGIPFNERGQGGIFYSDGQRWNTMAQGIAGNQFSSARVDAVERVHSHISQLISEAASAVTMTEAMRVTATADVLTGAWYNAICGVVDYQDDGYVTGLAGVICAEIDMPTSGVPGGSGTYWLFEGEINCPTGFTAGGVPMAVIGLNVWGAAKTEFDTVGLLFDISGVTSGAGDFYYDNTANAADAFLKCRVNGAVYYLALSDDQAWA